MPEKESDYLLKRYKEIASDIDDIEKIINDLFEELPELIELHR